MRNTGYHQFLLFLFGLILCYSCKSEEAVSQDKETEEVQVLRLVSLSGFLTETLYELGFGDHIIGRDVTSTYPGEAAALPNLGHISQLNLEAILEMKPSHVFIESTQLKQVESLKKLESAGISLVEVPTQKSLDNAIQASKHIGEFLKIEKSASEKLGETITLDGAKLQETLKQYTDQPRVLFIYARGAGRLMVGGTNTSASAIIEKAGGINAIQSFENFRALTPEALLEAAPDVILMFSSGLESLDGKAGLEQIPGISQTPAFKNNRIVAMDGSYLTSFGPRIGKAAIELATKIHGN